MEVVIIIAVAAFVLLAFEFLLPTGGALAVLGALGLVGAGVAAIGVDDWNAGDYVGPGLITLGVLSIATFFVITPKLLESQKRDHVRTGSEGVVGMEGDVRSALTPVGQIYVDGSLWKARDASSGEIAVGSRVRVESVDGLTLIVTPIGASQES